MKAGYPPNSQKEKQALASNASQLSKRCFECSEKPVGAWLASDADEVVFLLNRIDLIAGKPAPTGVYAN